MGRIDLVKIHPIYRFATDLSKEKGWPFQFKEDSGDYETAILIEKFTGDCRKPPTNGKFNWAGYWELFCPDILDFNNKIIIEYEEEAKPNTRNGAKLNKGHFPEQLNKRDQRRDMFYEIAKFRVCKIWESHKDWKPTLEDFLKVCAGTLS